jgi:hypothetical protein
MANKDAIIRCVSRRQRSRVCLFLFTGPWRRSTVCVGVSLRCSKYGLRWFRKWEVFLAWSSIIANQGSATCYQITCHKNLNAFNRRRFWDRPLLTK